MVESRWHLEIGGPITCGGVDRELFLTQGFVILRVSHADRCCPSNLRRL